MMWKEISATSWDRRIMHIPLPVDKLSFKDKDEVVSSDHLNKSDGQVFVVLVSTGSFNPPTVMHLRMFELARDALNKEGYYVAGGYMSPVNDAYAKRGLISADHRIQMCEIACQSSTFIMVDSWEAKQNSFQRTVLVLDRVRSFLTKNGIFSPESLKVMLLCGADLLESFATLGVWIREQVRTICRDYGVVCICREGKDINKIVCSDEILSEYKANILVVDKLVQDQISSTLVRDSIKNGQSINGLTPDDVIEYIQQHRLYLGENTQ
ncbi:hypothetical protein H6P81_008625 [Aristolochia fimbriata]|uniref:Nicotinamide-nucleotide adenylyltransferase n=1 Tax=Aristolochia fimbriata TaxID=158543 RepID=A0AAV7EKP9_ARIFI|nr:hypothetical protein H6P81_008625 [Aristolochia fimbriata]